MLDCEDARALAEFYRQLLGFRYRPGDEPPADGTPDIRGKDWLVLRDATGSSRLAFQQVPSLPEPTWPEDPTADAAPRYHGSNPGGLAHSA